MCGQAGLSRAGANSVEAAGRSGRTRGCSNWVSRLHGCLHLAHLRLCDSALPDIYTDVTEYHQNPFFIVGSLTCIFEEYTLIQVGQERLLSFIVECG
jgi:hypothetical protein